MSAKQYLKMADEFSLPVEDDTIEIYCRQHIGESFESGEMYAAHAINSHDELVAENEQLREVLEAAKGVVTRWDTPNWKDAEPTAAVIGRLRAIISKCSCSA